MSFFDSPIVDEKSKTSEESVLAVKQFFTKKNNFISRDEIPDYGVDLEVELILDNNKASGKKFSIQIKSTIELSVIKKNNDQFVSLEFKTSRLGYLCQKTPAYGLVIIYDDNSQILYYDYVYEIVNRITLQRGKEDWKEQENVNINIPIDNILNETNLSSIYNKFLNIFNQHDSLLAQHGKNFGLPIIDFLNSTSEQTINFNNISEILQLIDKYGIYLLNNNYYLHLHHLLSKLTFSDIEKSPKTLLVAALTYCEIGLYIESDYYIKRCMQIYKTFDTNEKEILDLTKNKVSFILGNIDKEIYLNNLIKLERTIENNLNKISIKLLIIHLKILISTRDYKNITTILPEIYNLFNDIEEYDYPKDRKYLIIVSLSDYLHEIGITLFINYSMILKMRDNINISTPIEERIKQAKEVYSLIETAVKKTTDSLKYSLENNDKLIESYSLFKLCSYFFQISLFSFQIKPEEITVEHKSKFQAKFIDSINSYKLFMDLGLLHEAYQSITLAYEISRIYFYQYKDDFNDLYSGDLLNTINELQSKIGLPEFSSLVDNYILQLKSNPSHQEYLSNASDQDILEYSKKMIEVLSIPEERLKNIIQDIKNSRLFYNQRKCKNMELLQDLRHTFSKETIYSKTIKYKIICKVCGEETFDDEDINKLLELFSYSKCKEN